MTKINLSDKLFEIIVHIVQEYKIFSHIDVTKLQILISRNRKTHKSGILAKIIGRKEIPAGYSISHFPAGKLYLIYFYWPRFFEYNFNQKADVIFHELYHISEEFDGSFRKFGKLYHGKNKNDFDKEYKSYLQEFIDYHNQKPVNNAVLTMNAVEMKKKYEIRGNLYKLPRLMKKK
ncbi:MAG: putative metallopeptidase [Spirochaetia bacterium]|nr:putative metallopeptidase [Spirochaetia bacterium]